MKSTKLGILCSLAAVSVACSTQRAPDAPVATTEPAVGTSHTSSEHATGPRATTGETAGAAAHAHDRAAGASKSSSDESARLDTPRALDDGRGVPPAAGSGDSSTTLASASTGGGPAPDNTRVNARDRHDGTLTPMDQGGSEADRTTTQKIRQAVVGDKALSFNAKNVKIITVNGRVTLRGPVKSDAERANIEAKAREVAGSSQVDNQLEVKP